MAGLAALIEDHFSAFVNGDSVHAEHGDMFVISTHGDLEQLVGLIQAGIRLLEDPQMSDTNPVLRHPHLHELGLSMALAYESDESAEDSDLRTASLKNTARAMASIARDRQVIVDGNEPETMKLLLTADGVVIEPEEPLERAIVGLEKPWPVTQVVLHDSNQEICSPQLLIAQLSRLLAVTSNMWLSLPNIGRKVSELEGAADLETADTLRATARPLHDDVNDLIAQRARGTELAHEAGLVAMLDELSSTWDSLENLMNQAVRSPVGIAKELAGNIRKQFAIFRTALENLHASATHRIEGLGVQLGVDVYVAKVTA